MKEISKINCESLSGRDLHLVELAKEFLRENYKLHKHHVASVLNCGGKLYYSLHLDITGFDVCAEPIVLSNALLDKQTQFSTLVSVIKKDGFVEVVNPCGNCREMLVCYAPNVEIIVSLGEELAKVKPSDLLPLPYLA